MHQYVDLIDVQRKVLRSNASAANVHNDQSEEEVDYEQTTWLEL